jgi:hypothetical protein
MLRMVPLPRFAGEEPVVRLLRELRLDRINVGT